MNIDQLIDLEIKTRKKVDELELEIERLRESAAPVPQLDGSVGRLSRQDRMLDQAMSKELLRRLEDQLLGLREALDRMDRGTYGICVRCRGEIAYERLSAMPEIAMCGNCAR